MYMRFSYVFMVMCIGVLAGDGVQEKRALESQTYEGQNAMGPNHFMGGPIADLGEPFGLVNLYSVGLYNPFGPEPIKITPDMNIEHPYSAVLATIVDPTFAAFGAPIEFEAEYLNVPLHEVPVALDGIGEVTGVLGPPHTAGQLDTHRAAPYGPITLGQWLEASGRCTFTCLSDGGSEMVIELEHLLPNSLYTIWGIFGGGPVALTPLGGVPNVVATDDNGVGRVRRILNWCPLNPKEGDRPLLWISIAFHSDHAVYGNVPAPYNWPEGLIHHTQLQFFIAATVLGEDNDGGGSGIPDIKFKK